MRSSTSSAKTSARDSSGDGGFTIVELLIVIIVIGILAVIGLISYSNVQQQAENTKTIAAVRSYGQLLSMYRVANGSYPPYDDTNNLSKFACLGTEYPNNACMSTDGTPVGQGRVNGIDYPGTGIVFGNPTFNTALQPAGTALPTASKQIVMIEGHPMVGAFVNLRSDNNDDTISYWYVLAGKNAQCSKAGIPGILVERSRSASGVFCGINRS